MRHLTTQMKWRLSNGDGKAVYIVGIEDDGTPCGISAAKLKLSLAVLQRMADALGANIGTVQYFKGQSTSSRIARVFVSQSISELPATPEVRAALLGAAACGKSTLCGVLANGDMDDGEGQARYFVFRHEHEIDDGRTSSVSCQLVGFDAQGALVNASAESIGAEVTPAEIAARSTRMLSILDLAGHHKYLKTTVVGMMGHLPDIALLVVDATKGVQQMTREHLGIALALNIPTAVVINKIDLLVDAVERSKVVESVRGLLRAAGGGLRLQPLTSVAQCLEAAEMLGVPHERMKQAPRGLGSPVHMQQVPLLLCSQVTGEGLPQLTAFLSKLQSARNNAHFCNMPPSLQVVDCFDVAGVGTVAAGTVFSGVIRVGDELALGPDGLGGFLPVKVASIHCNCAPVASVQAGQSAALSLHDRVVPVEGGAASVSVPRAAVRKGMVLLHPSTARSTSATREFDATITVLRHGTPITQRTQLTVFSGSFKQSAGIVWMQKTKLLAGDVAAVRLRLQHRPEFLQLSQPVLLTARPAVAIGTITRVGAVALHRRSERSGMPRSESFDVNSLLSAESRVQTPTLHSAAPPGFLRGAAAATDELLPASGSDTACSAGAGSTPLFSAPRGPAYAPSIISILAGPETVIDAVT
jgi:GTPase